MSRAEAILSGPAVADALADAALRAAALERSEEHTSELQSH